jgi:hypothetical protein
MAQSTINNGQLGLIIRTALNSMFTELYTHIAGQIHTGAIHGLRVTAGQLEFFDGSVWKTVETEIEELAASVVSLVTTGFAGNLDGTVDDVQKLAAAVDTLDIPPHTVLSEYRNTVTVTGSPTGTVSIGIPEFVSTTDILIVHQNSTFIEKTVDYLVPDSLGITKIADTWPVGTEINFLVIRLETV